MRGGVARGVARRLLAVLAALALVAGPAATQTTGQTTTTYKYDALGRLIAVADKDVDTGITSRPTEYNYDNAGNRTRVSHGDGIKELYVVDHGFTSSSTDGRYNGQPTGLD